jgi:hypothetical protein
MNQPVCGLTSLFGGYSPYLIFLEYFGSSSHSKPASFRARITTWKCALYIEATRQMSVESRTRHIKYMPKS